MFMGCSTTLLRPVLINREQLARFWPCTRTIYYIIFAILMADKVNRYWPVGTDSRTPLWLFVWYYDTPIDRKSSQILSKLFSLPENVNKALFALTFSFYLKSNDLSRYNGISQAGDLSDMFPSSLTRVILVEDNLRYLSVCLSIFILLAAICIKAKSRNPLNTVQQGTQTIKLKQFLVSVVCTKIYR